MSIERVTEAVPIFGGDDEEVRKPRQVEGMAFAWTPTRTASWVTGL